VVSRPGHLYEAPAGVRLERLDRSSYRVSSEIPAGAGGGERPAESPEACIGVHIGHGYTGRE